MKKRLFGLIVLMCFVFSISSNAYAGFWNALTGKNKQSQGNADPIQAPAPSASQSVTDVSNTTDSTSSLYASMMSLLKQAQEDKKAMNELKEQNQKLKEQAKLQVKQKQEEIKKKIEQIKKERQASRRQLTELERKKKRTQMWSQNKQQSGKTYPIDPLDKKKMPPEPLKKTAMPPDPLGKKVMPPDPLEKGKKGKAYPIDPLDKKGMPVDPYDSKTMPIDPYNSKAMPPDPLDKQIHALKNTINQQNNQIKQLKQAMTGLNTNSLEKINAQIDRLLEQGSSSEMDMMKLQELMEKQNRAFQAVSNALKNSHDTMQGIVRNMK